MDTFGIGPVSPTHSANSPLELSVEDLKTKLPKVPSRP